MQAIFYFIKKINYIYMSKKDLSYNWKNNVIYKWIIFSFMILIQWLFILVLIVSERTDGKVTTCFESIESVDEEKKTINYKLFGEDIDHRFKVFKLVFQAIDKNQGGAIIKWTIEYEKVDEKVDPPYGYIEYVHKCTRDMDVHLVKA